MAAVARRAARGHPARVRGPLPRDVQPRGEELRAPHLRRRGRRSAACALRSSRSEPFGERFLREALRRTMRGDVARPARRLPRRRRARSAAARSPPPRWRRARASRRRPRPTSPRAARTARPRTRRSSPPGRTRWSPGERVRYYRARGAERTCSLPGRRRRTGGAATATRATTTWSTTSACWSSSYASRLRKAFAPEDFERMFRSEEQIGLFDRPIEAIAPRWIRCPVRRC